MAERAAPAKRRQAVTVDEALIDAVALNARITLTDKERTKLLQDFKDILDAFSAIAEAPAAEIPAIHPELVMDVVRQDTPTPCLSQDDALRNTQHKKGGYFKGPKVSR